MGSRVTLETSWPPTMAELDPERVVAIIRRHGADRVVYGSDWPMADPAAEMAAIRALPLTPEESDGILGDNLARMLGLHDPHERQGRPARRRAWRSGATACVPRSRWSSAATSTTSAATTSPS